MSEQLLSVHGNITGLDRVKKMINAAPEEYERGVRTWLYSTRNTFVGNNRKSEQKDGVFRRKLMRKTNSRGAQWGTNIARLFKGRIVDIKNINMKLEMGLLSRNRGKMIRAIESLQEDHTVNSSKYMPIPVWKNLPGVKALYKAYMLFKSKMQRNELTAVRDGDSVLYFDKGNSKLSGNMSPYNMHNKNELLFIGKRRVKVKRQYNFEGDWNKRVPAVIIKYRNMIDRTTQRVANKYGFN